MRLHVTSTSTDSNGTFKAVFLKTYVYHTNLIKESNQNLNRV